MTLTASRSERKERSHELALELEPQLDAGHRTREAIRARLGWLPERTASDLLAVVTELVNNAVIHGPGEPIQIRITVDDDGHIRGEVSDQGQGRVAIRELAADRTGGGFGLRIVDGLTDRWGAYEGSTHVWFEMRFA